MRIEVGVRHRYHPSEVELDVEPAAHCSVSGPCPARAARIDRPKRVSLGIGCGAGPDVCLEAVVWTGKWRLEIRQ